GDRTRRAGSGPGPCGLKTTTQRRCTTHVVHRCDLDSPLPGYTPDRAGGCALHTHRSGSRPIRVLPLPALPLGRAGGGTARSTTNTQVRPTPTGVGHPGATHTDAAVCETEEEYGLTVTPGDLDLVLHRWLPNRCGADIPALPHGGHEWMVYRARVW